MAQNFPLYSLLSATTPQTRPDATSVAGRRSITGRIALDSNINPVQHLRFDDSFNDSLSGRNERTSSTHLISRENSYADSPGRGRSTLQRGSFLPDITHNDSDYEGMLDFSHTTLMTIPDQTTDFTTTIMPDEDPGHTVTAQLGQEFRDLYVEYSGEHEIFDLLLRYEEACTQSLNYLKDITKKAGSVQQKFPKTAQVLKRLRAERDTWRLVRILFKDRLESDSNGDEDSLMDTLRKRISDKEIIDNLYQGNSFIRQSQLVVDWLEKNAADDFDESLFEKMEHFSDQCVGWEHTLHSLNKMMESDSDLQQPTMNDLITEMDPDAPLRQKDNTLSDLDKESDNHLLRFMYLCIRAGNLSKAQRLAEKYGHSWLAAALEGWRLHHDPNYDNGATAEGESLLPVEGNEYRDIWKSVCWNAALDGNVPMYEKAIFGALSGNLRAVLPVCDSWEDYLWAYFRVLIDQHIEEVLYSSTQQEHSLEDLPPLYWDKILDVKQIFQDMKASESEEVRKEEMSSLRVIQKLLILNDIDGLVEQLYSWLQNNPSKVDSLKRFMSHLIYFLRVVGRSDKHEISITILESYVEELIKNRCLPVVAAYVATLPAARQIMWYAEFLEGITDNKERQQCLQYAEEAGLDVPRITKTVVENMRSKDVTLTEGSPGLRVETTEEDKLKIESIDWLVFDPTQRSEAIKQANALMRVFVACKKLDAAKQVFVKIPPDSLALLMEQWNKITGSDELSAEDDNAAREYLCFKAYLEAHDAFNDWFNHFQHARPVCPPPLTGDHIKFKERVMYECQVNQYQADLEMWESVLSSQTKTTTDRLYNILLFVGGGWMVDQRVEEDVDEGRQKQLSLLRKLCIPQITVLLRNILHYTGKYKECVQLADIIASERNKLYKEFSVQELHDFLSMILKSSEALLDQKLDPLGYPHK